MNNSTETAQMNISKIIFREDLYPRFEPDQRLIEKYYNSIDYLPPIIVNQNNILIDGYHRLKAHELNGDTNIEVEIIKTQSEKELKKLAYKLNSNHGSQLRNDEKKRYAREMIGEMTKQELSQILSVSEKSIERWTVNQREAIKEEKNRKVVEMYLRAENNQEYISQNIDVPQSSISNIVKNIVKRQMSDFDKEFQPNIYNIWNLQKADKETSHFGYFPEVFMENLLYNHTIPRDIIYDPFCGAGTTIDVCKRMSRRYYCSDMIMKPGREKDMKVRKIQDGMPKELHRIDLTFLDPPYHLQAKGKYSNSDDDLGNMTLDSFYKSFQTFLEELIDRKIPRIAIVIRPSQLKENNYEYEDHIFQFDSFLRNQYKIEMRYILPYHTQQYNGTQVEKYKAEKVCMTLNRDLVVWKLR